MILPPARSGIDCALRRMPADRSQPRSTVRRTFGSVVGTRVPYVAARGGGG